MKKKLFALLLSLTVFSTMIYVPTKAADATTGEYKKVVFAEKFNATSFTDPNSPWGFYGDGWSTTSTPSDPAAPLRTGSTHVAAFEWYELENNDFGCIGTKEKINLTNVKSVEVSWYMYHDREDDYDEYIWEDQIAVYHSDNNSLFSSYNNSLVNRYDGSIGWKKHSYSIDITKDSPAESYFGLIAYSDYGFNMFVDEVTITLTMTDKTAPAKPVIKPSTTKNTSGKVTVSITPGTDTESGVSKTEYKIGNGAWNTYTAPFSVTSNTTVYARTIDNVGLISAQSSLVINNITKKDKTKPVITAKTGKKKIKNGAKVKKKVTVSVTDNNIKSIKVLYKKKTQTFNKKKTFKKKGVYKITVLDQAGNKSTFKFTIK